MSGIAKGGANRKIRRGDADVAVVSASDFMRLKRNATSTNEEEIAAANQRAIRAKELETAEMRKQKIKEMEHARRSKQPISALEKEAADRASNLVSQAKKQLDEQEDSVKHMNGIITFAKTMTIRDAQLEEKKRIKALKEQEEREEYMRMEADRLRSLEEHREKERRVKIARRKDAESIKVQIKEREHQRMLEKERVEQDKEAISRQIKQIEIEEKQKAEERVLRSKQLRDEVKLANIELERNKAEDRKRLEDEERRIWEYMQERERKQAERDAELERIASIKAGHIEQIRARQENALDKAAEMDELRAKRAQEARERKWRADQKAKLDKQAEIQRGLAQARKEQMIRKQRQMLQIVHDEKKEFDRILKENDRQIASEQEKVDKDSNYRAQLSAELKSQIDNNEQSRKAQQKAKFLEGEKVRDKIQEERDRIYRVKEEKLEVLRKAGVPEKYMVDLKRMKVSF